MFGIVVGYIIEALVATIATIATFKAVQYVAEEVEDEIEEFEENVKEDVDEFIQGIVIDAAEVLFSQESLSYESIDSITNQIGQSASDNICDIMNMVQTDISSIDTSIIDSLFPMDAIDNISTPKVIDQPSIEVIPAYEGDTESIIIDNPPKVDLPNILIDVPPVIEKENITINNPPVIEPIRITDVPAEKAVGMDDLICFEKIDYGSTDLSKIASEYRVDENIYTARNIAVFEYTHNNETKTIVKASKRGVGHAERLIAKELETLGIDPSEVTRIYSELEPCCVPGGYCKRFIENTFPQAEVTYSFEYGSEKSSRTKGVNELKDTVKLLKNYIINKGER